MFGVEEEEDDGKFAEGAKRKLGFWGGNNNGDDINDNGGKGSWPSIGGKSFSLKRKRVRKRK